MNHSFDCIVSGFPMLLRRLLQREPCDRWCLGDTPKRGIYVFFENGAPVYVGRSSNLRSRLLSHGCPSSDRYSATFALRLAKEEAQRQGMTIKRRKGAELEADPEFRDIFAAMRDRVAKMQIKYVEVDDANTQALFEIYVHMALQTPHNDFENH